MERTHRAPGSSATSRRGLRILLQAGFVFFLLKGMGWLLLGWLAWARLG